MFARELDETLAEERIAAKFAVKDSKTSTSGYVNFLMRKCGIPSKNVRVEAAESQMFVGADDNDG